jgi:hypothetical protein
MLMHPLKITLQCKKVLEVKSWSIGASMVVGDVIAFNDAYLTS